MADSPASRSGSRGTDVFWMAVSLSVLLICLRYAYVAKVPDIGFELGVDWRVVSASPCDPGTQCVRVGDKILAIGEVTGKAFGRSRTLSYLKAFDNKSKQAPVRLIRDKKVMVVEARVHPSSLGLLRSEMLAVLFPLVFWLMGTVVVIFLRPRDERWLVLALFGYVTALWFSAGLASYRHVDGSAVVFHVFIWLSLPLLIHLHTILPSPLFSRGRYAFLASLYAVSLLLAALDGLHLLEGLRYANYFWFSAGVVLSLGVLLARLWLPVEPAVKVANRIMLFGVILGFGPLFPLYIMLPLVTSHLVQSNRDIQLFYNWATAICLLSIPILPASYIYAIYKHYLGALEFRANRLLGVYSFFSLYITVYVVALLVVSSVWAPINGRSLAATLVVSLVFVSTGPFLRGRFQSLVDRHVFGIRHAPEEVVAIVSERVPAAFDRAILARVIVEEILPTLLIRQSALHLFENSHVETLFELALPEGQPAPSSEELRTMLWRGGRYLDPPERRWVRLAIPLQVKAETIGIWLIGRRDPDDFYPTQDIHLLSTVANQIAPVVENIRLYERAQREILQRKQAELEIRRSEERFRHLFEATLEGIALVRGGAILEVNPALLAIFGYEPGELIGRRLTDLVPEGDDGLTGVPREGIGRRRDGSPVDIEVAGKKYLFQGEDVTVVAIRDIARRKRDEAENRMLQQQLLHSSKMEAIGRLSAGVAHDFNNCLLAIFGYSDLLLATYREDPLLSRTLTGIKDAGQKAASLTKQLLAFTRRQPMEAKVMDLNEVVAGVEKMLRPLLGEDITLETDLHPRLARVRIDPGQIEQVIVNMAVNARHAMPEGGRLSLRTAPLAVDSGAPAPHVDVPPGSWVLLTVTDTGIGMTPETKARVFEPFFSTKKLGEGTGLGLATAYGIVQQSGGRIFVDSDPGRGASFSIYLPAAQEAAALPVATVAGTGETGTETLLLVEDEEEVRALLRQMLAEKGYRVLQAGSADEALEAAARHEEPIHLLLTDVIMPKVKGTELAARLVAERPGLKVLYMSGYNEEPLAGGPGSAPCLQKPFSSQDLARAVRAVLDAGASAAA
jgi:two-component system cell cycle sensor histidine kinase/response regulator CckA